MYFYNPNEKEWAKKGKFEDRVERRGTWWDKVSEEWGDKIQGTRGVISFEYHDVIIC